MKLGLCIGAWVVAELFVPPEVSSFITKTVSIELLGRGIRTHRHSWSQKAGAVCPGLDKGRLTGKFKVVNMAADG